MNKLLLAVILIGTCISSPMLFGEGNSGNVQKCANGGWKELTTNTGDRFKNMGACVSYGAQGGIYFNPKVNVESGCYISFAINPTQVSIVFKAKITNTGFAPNSSGTLEFDAISQTNSPLPHQISSQHLELNSVPTDPNGIAIVEDNFTTTFPRNLLPPGVSTNDLRVLLSGVTFTTDDVSSTATQSFLIENFCI